MRTGTLEVALAALDAGIPVMPIRDDGSKAPALNEWVWLRERMPSGDQVAAWFGGGSRHGLAVVCGVDGLECLDADDDGVYRAMLDHGKGIGLGELLDRVRGGYEERTPSDGVHLLFRSETAGRSDKLAERPGPDPTRPKHERSVLLETRGDGGYVVVAPSGGAVHPTGRAWELVSGGFGSIAVLSLAEREALLALARSLDEMPAEEARRDQTPLPVAAGRPGDAYRSAHGTLEAFAPIVEAHGWTLAYRRNGVGYFRRPGKRQGISATFGHAGTDLFYVFSTSTALEANRGHGPFAVYVALEHGGDWQAAARALAEEGYGERSATLATWPLAFGRRPIVRQPIGRRRIGRTRIATVVAGQGVLR